MINSKALNGLFKPYKIVKTNFEDFFIKHVGVKKFWKIQFEDECSKSIDETCINTECMYNYLNMHGDELYIELMQEIQAERKAVEDKTKRDMEKYYGKS